MVARAGQRRRLLAWAGIALAVGLVSLAGRHAPAGAQVEGLTGAERQEAAALYAAQCASCHGAAGGGAIVPGTQRPAPPLRGRPDVDVAYMDLVLRTGRMPPAGDPFDSRPRRVAFDDRQRRILVAYLAETFGLSGVVPQVARGDPAVGRDVYELNCAHCHGSTGAGGVAGAGAWTPAVTGYDPVTVAAAVRVGPFQMPAFDPGQITDEEVAGVAAFLDEVEAEPGTLLALVELNPVYASALVALLTLVVVVSLLWIGGRPTWFPDPEE